MMARDSHGKPLRPGDRVTLSGVVKLAPDGTPPEVLVLPDTEAGKGYVVQVWLDARAVSKVAP